MFTSLLSLFAAGATLATALPTSPSPSARDVIDCAITYPTSGTTWQSGNMYTATWNTSCLAAEPGSKVQGQLLLGYSTNGSTSEHLMYSNPLANGFLLEDGQHSFSLPGELETMDSYFLVLLGDSGNKSPEFTITENASGDYGN